MIDEAILHDFANEPVEGVRLAMLTNLQDRQAAGLANEDGIGHDLSLAIAAAGCRGFIVGALVAMDDPHLASGIVSLAGEFSAEDEMDQHRTSARNLLEKAHGADPAWTVQRADVDAWFGSLFEKDFLAIEQRGRPVAGEALLNRGMAQRFRPEITVDGQVVAHYPRRGRVPEAHTAVDVNIRDATVSLALKLTPSEVLSSRGGEWEVRVQKDIRVQALVSVLKAAHLTMFHLLGYRYALSGGGRFLGMDVLGTLFLKSQGMERPASLTLAKHHLRQFSSMVRPVIEAPTETPGTITDRCVHFLMRGHEIWGCLVFVRTGNHLHAAVVPILESPESASLFARFLESPAMRIETRMGRLGRHAVELSPSSQSIDWPEAPFDV